MLLFLSTQKVVMTHLRVKKKIKQFLWNTKPETQLLSTFQNNVENTSEVERKKVHVKVFDFGGWYIHDPLLDFQNLKSWWKIMISTVQKTCFYHNILILFLKKIQNKKIVETKFWKTVSENLLFGFLESLET